MPSSRWKPRDPRIFPANFFSTMRMAAKHSPDEILLGNFENHADALALADRFREFRFCLRHWRGTMDVQAIEREYRVVTRIRGGYALGFNLWTIAYPRTDIAAANPHIAELVASIE